MFFNRINRNQALLGLPLLLTPPAPPIFSLPTVGPLSITSKRGKPVLTVPVSELPAGHTLLYASRPQNPGRRYCDKFTYLGLLPTPVAGQSNITQVYAAKFGFPPAGTRVFVRTVQQINGYRNVPLQTHALVPALQPPRPTAKAPTLT